MLSLFPELLFLSPFAAFIIRIALAAVFSYSAYTRLPSKNTLLITFGVIDAAIAILFFVGAYTQLASLVGTLCAIAWLIKPSISPLARSTVALVLVMCLSSLVLGAGPFAFDLPL